MSIKSKFYFAHFNLNWQKRVKLPLEMQGVALERLLNDSP